MAASQVPCSDGEAERGREMEDEQEAEQPVRALADLEQLLLGRGDGGHIPVIDTDGNVLGGARSLACPGDPTALQEEPSMSDVTTIEADVPERYADAVSTRLQTRRRRGRRRPDLAQGRDAVGARGHARGHQPARLARHRRALSASSSTSSTRFAEELCAPRATRDAVVLGMGGSSLAPEVFRQSFGKQEPGSTLHVLDSTHPDAGPRGPRRASTSTRR